MSDRLDVDPDELVLYEGVQRLLDGQLARPDLVVYIPARVDVPAERLGKRTFERHIRHRVPRERPRGVPRLVFYYDETPLLVVDSSERDFVDDPGDLEDLLREIDRTVTGSHSYVPRNARQEHQKNHNQRGTLPYDRLFH